MYSMLKCTCNILSVVGGDQLPKIVDYEEKRQEIVQNAIDVFCERGYYDTTFAHIAKACGMARTTLYQYFDNKDEIFTQVMLEVLGDLERECRSIVDQPGISVIDKIKLIFSRLCGQCHIKRGKVGILLDLLVLLKLRKNHIDDSVNESFADFKQIFLDLLQEGVKSREIKAIETESMAITLYNLLRASVFKVSAQKEDISQGYIQNLHILLDGLKA